jgi:hypothetical protein
VKQAVNEARRPVLKFCTTDEIRDKVCAALSPEVASKRPKLSAELEKAVATAQKLRSEVALTQPDAISYARMKGQVAYQEHMSHAYEFLLTRMAEIEADDAADEEAIRAAVAALPRPLSNEEAGQWVLQCHADVTSALAAAKKVAAETAGPAIALKMLQDRLEGLKKEMRSLRASVKKEAPRLGLASSASSHEVEAEVERRKADVKNLEQQAKHSRGAAEAARNAAAALLRDRVALQALGYEGKIETLEAHVTKLPEDQLVTEKDTLPWMAVADTRHPEKLAQPGYSWMLVYAEKLRDQLQKKAQAAAKARQEDSKKAEARVQEAAAALKKLGGPAAAVKADETLAAARAARERHAAAREKLLAAYKDAEHKVLDLDAEVAIDGKATAAAAILKAKKKKNLLNSLTSSELPTATTRELLRATAKAAAKAAVKAADAAITRRAAALAAFEAALQAPLTVDEALDIARWLGLAGGRGAALPYKHSTPLERVAAPYVATPFDLVMKDAMKPLGPQLAALLRRAGACGAAQQLRRSAHVAAATGRLELLQNATPAELVERDDDGATPLLVALRARTPRARAVAEWLLQQDTARLHAGLWDHDGRSALFELRTGDEALCRRLLAVGVSPTSVDTHGQSAIHEAAAQLAAPVLVLMLDSLTAREAALLIRDGAGRMPLHCALAAAAKPGADRIAAEASIRATVAPHALTKADHAGARPLTLAAAVPAGLCGPVVDAFYLLDDEYMADACRGCALHALARVPAAGALVTRALLCGGDARLRAGETSTLALHAAASAQAATALLNAFPGGLNARDAGGRTAFWHACATDAEAVAAVLMDAGAVAVGEEAASTSGERPVDVAGPACRALLRKAQEAHDAARARRLAALRKRAGASAEDTAEPVPLSAEETEEWTTRGDAALCALREEVDALIATGPADKPASWQEEQAAAAAAAQADASTHADSTSAPLPPFDPELAQLDARRWSVQLSREAKQSLFALQGGLREAAMRQLAALADGDFRGAQYLKTPIGEVFKFGKCPRYGHRGPSAC